MESDRADTLPSELCSNGSVSNGSVTLDADRLTARFLPGAHPQRRTVTALNANELVPRNASVFYFEMTVNAGEDGLVHTTIGFLDESFKPERQPGCVSSAPAIQWPGTCNTGRFENRFVWDGYRCIILPDSVSVTASVVTSVTAYAKLQLNLLAS